MSIWKNGYVDVYETVTRYIPYQQHISKLVEMLNLNSCSKVLDMGCGTGLVG